MLLNSRTQTVSIPEEKRLKAIVLLTNILGSTNTTVLKVQQLAGLFKFLSRTIIYEKIFNRNYYAKTTNKNKVLKPYHHVRVDKEMCLGCGTWLTFLNEGNAILWPFIDFKANTVSADTIRFFLDASRAHHLGFGAVFENSWTFSTLKPNYIRNCQTCIEYLELYALTVAVYLWAHR